MSAEDWHTPVMLADILGTLAPRADATYLDATFGAGGCAKALLEAARCTVFGIDRDPEACARAATLCRRYGGRLVVLHGRFGDMQRLLGNAGIDRVDGVAFDLGTSSMQLDAPERGFSFRADGPLDMRMDPESGVPAADVVNHAAEGELTRILSEFGEERAARRVARAIVAARRASPITGTARLAEIVRTVLPWRRDTIDPATRTFQALRIHVNDELGELDRGLIAAERLLKAGGRLCVVAFHSLEDRKVKTFLRTRSGEQQGTSRHRPDLGPATAPSFRLLHKHAVRPSAAEVAANPRARSARLRAAERTTAAPWSEPERRAA